MARPGDEIGPSKYRKKPVVIEAMRWSGTNLRELIDFTGLHPSANKWTWEEYEAVVAKDGFKIFTLEGAHHVTEGDYIIKGVKGEFYACKPDIFLMTYDRADSSALAEVTAFNVPKEWGAAAKVLHELLTRNPWPTSDPRWQFIEKWAQDVQRLSGPSRP